MHRWWSRCLDRAGIAHRPMHEARHTAITVPAPHREPEAFADARRPCRLGTANIYAHLDTSDLETALRALNEDPS
jgi:hypothetical protein